MKLFSRNTKAVELWVVWDEDCNVAADMDRDSARQRLEDDFSNPVAREMRLSLTLPIPAPIEADLTVSDDTETVAIKLGR